MTDRFEIIPFNDHSILTVQRSDGIAVVMKPVAERMGLNWRGQLNRIQRHPVLSEGVAVMATPSTGGMQDAITLGLEQFHGWLITISPDRVADARTRDLIIDYQRRAFRVIFEHFHGPIDARLPGIEPVSARIALQNQALRLTARLQRTMNKAERRLMHTFLDGICRDLTVETPALDQLGHDAPEPPDLLAEFWQAIGVLRAAAVEFDHSRAPGFVAINLPQLKSLFAQAKIGLRIDREMKAALRLSQNPRFVANKPVNSIEGKTMNCWVFELVN